LNVKPLLNRTDCWRNDNNPTNVGHEQGRCSILKPAWRLLAEADVQCFDQKRLGLGRQPPFISRPRSGHEPRARTMCEQALRQNRPFQLERLRTVFDTNGSSRANAACVGFGIARTALSTLRMSSLIRFYKRTEHRNELNPKRANRLHESETSLSAESGPFLCACTNQNAGQ
jgi:hypothetical protein